MFYWIEPKLEEDTLDEVKLCLNISTSFSYLIIVLVFGKDMYLDMNCMPFITRTLLSLYVIPATIICIVLMLVVLFFLILYKPP